MKIQSATVYEYNRSFCGHKRQGLLLELKTTDGKASWGEVAPLQPFSKESFNEAKNELLSELPFLINEEWHPTHVSPSVHFGIESAILDLSLPIKPKPHLVNGLLTGTPEEMKKQAGNLTGYSAVKIKVGHLPIEKSIALIQELRPLLPRHIRIDANQSWTFDEALEFAKAFPLNTFEYFEEPFTDCEDAFSFPYPLALDESLRLLSPDDIFSLPHLKALIIKPTLMGGCTKILPLTQQAEQKGVAFILSSSYESELGLSLLSKMAQRLDLPEIPMGFDTSHLFEEPLFEEEILRKQGKIFFPDAWNLKKGRVIAHECL